LAGAAILGGGYYAWHEHEKKKTEEEVSFSYRFFFKSLAYPSSRRRNKRSRGVCKDGIRTLVGALKSSATTDLVLPPPGFSSTGVTRFQTRPWKPEKTKMAIRSISHAHITKIVSVRSIGLLFIKKNISIYLFACSFRNWQGFSRLQGRRSHRLRRPSYRGKLIKLIRNQIFSPFFNFFYQ
jgi:hypothetical protein